MWMRRSASASSCRTLPSSAARCAGSSRRRWGEPSTPRSLSTFRSASRCPRIPSSTPLSSCSSSPAARSHSTARACCSARLLLPRATQRWSRAHVSTQPCGGVRSPNLRSTVSSCCFIHARRSRRFPCCLRSSSRCRSSARRACSARSRPPNGAARSRRRSRSPAFRASASSIRPSTRRSRNGTRSSRGSRASSAWLRRWAIPKRSRACGAWRRTPLSSPNRPTSRCRFSACSNRPAARSIISG